MKRRWLIILALTLVTAMFANGANRYEVVAWQEDFESGATGWTHYDGAVSPNNWHIYNNNDAQGQVWWMGDPALASGANIGGYYDHQYLVLDTPARTVTAGNTNLTFKLRYNVEATAGATAPYNGWDACNVRMSVDGGNVWTPISGTPAYNMTSSYAFGFEHGEGPNIPGWGGVQTTWANATFNLSAYVGQSVKIRFAFASDPAYSTGDAAAMFGMMVDDIAFADYTNNGVDDGQMTWASMVPLGGDLWNLVTEATAPSPTHVMKCQNAQGTYNTNMMNYLVSPPITLPTDGDIRADFMITGSFTDPNTFPEVDYFGWEISVNNGVTWYAMSNPYGSATGSNYVYSDAPPTWSSMTESYTLDGLISDYAGQTIQMRWYFKSDTDTPQGTGIMIDDVKIYNDIFIAPPEELTATVNGSNVTLNWIEPGTGGGGEEGWLHYDGENAGNAIGTNGVADFDVAAKWDAIGDYGIIDYVGMNITKIQIFPAEPTTLVSYAIRIWTGAAGDLAYEQVITPVADQWNEIILTTPWTIPAQTQIMAGYRCNATGGYPAGCDAGPQVQGYGNMIRWNNAWTTLTALSSALTYNWNIRIYVQDAAGREYEITQLPQNVQPFSSTLLAESGNVREPRPVTAYKVFRDGVQIDQIAGTLLTYTDMNVPGGVHTYYLTALYGANESGPSNTATVFVMGAMDAELFHDDGTAEAGFSVGATKQMAVKHIFGGAVTVKYAKVYVHTLGTAGIIMRVWDNDGADGTPGTQLAQYQYPAASVVEGWNYIALPAGITVPDGQFYVGILETANASQIGLDQSSNGFSFQRLTTVWEPVTTGEVMIRAIIEHSGAVLNPPTGLTAEVVNSNDVHLAWNAPATRVLTGYKIYRNGALIATITNPATHVYNDLALANGTYSYTVTATYTEGESAPAGPVSVTIGMTLDPPTNLTAEVYNTNSVHLTWTAPGGTTPEGFSDGFETYADFALTFDPWTLVDVDQSTTYGMTGISWPNVYLAQAYMIFNPSTTVPPVTDAATHGGAKMAACFASVTPPNNDWMISPLVSPVAGDFLSFYAKSYTAQYGLERFKVGISTGGTAPANFTIISGASYVSVPVDWTLYSYDLSAYAGQQVRFGIQCVSNDAFIYFVDDVTVGPIPVSKEASFASFQQEGTVLRNTGTAVPARIYNNPPTRELNGYKVYRDGVLIQTITGAGIVAYDDVALANGTYSYTVTATYTEGESAPAGPVSVTIGTALAPPLNLAAAVDGNDVTLTWTSPEAPPTGTWITWCNDVLGNSIGTNSAGVWDVAHRFTQTDLAPHAGGVISQVRFVPNYPDCTYTIKVWTGGSATNAGTLVSSQLVSPFVEDAWNLVILNTPVPIPTTGDVYIGYEVNTQGGYPAGCDNGPQIEGKGNMMYFQGAWTTLSALAPTLTYNWLIQTFVETDAALKAVELTPIAEHQSISYPQGQLALQSSDAVPMRDRAINGFKVFRDGVLISTITDPGITTYTDMDLPNGTYVYGVSATYTNGESAPATVTAIVNVILAPVLFEDGFETYADFALQFAPWTLIDVDLSATYGIQNVTFPNSESPMAYIIFNPSATTPPITTLVPHGGAKMAASFASVTPPNNDWMITPRIHLGTGSVLKFYAKSHTAQYGLERFRVGISTLATIIPQGFQYVSGPDYVEAPVNWTEFMYDLSAYDNQAVWIGIRCVSNDAFVFYVDDFAVHSNGGWVNNDDPQAPVLATKLEGNYPNPFNPQTTISYSVKENTPVKIEIYNVKGQLVKTLVNEVKASGNHSVIWNGLDNNGRSSSSGVYFYKMSTGKFSSTKKMIMMK